MKGPRRTVDACTPLELIITSSCTSSRSTFAAFVFFPCIQHITTQYHSEESVFCFVDVLYAHPTRNHNELHEFQNRCVSFSTNQLLLCSCSCMYSSYNHKLISFRRTRYMTLLTKDVDLQTQTACARAPHLSSPSWWHSSCAWPPSSPPLRRPIDASSCCASCASSSSAHRLTNAFTQHYCSVYWYSKWAIKPAARFRY